MTWCEQHCILSAPTNALVYTSCISLLIFCYVFRHNRHLHGAYTSVVRTYSNQTAVHWYISSEQVSVGADSLQFISQFTAWTIRKIWPNMSAYKFHLQILIDPSTCLPTLQWKTDYSKIKSFFIELCPSKAPCWQAENIKALSLSHCRRNPVRLALRYNKHTEILKTKSSSPKVPFVPARAKRDTKLNSHGPLRNPSWGT